MDVQAVKRQCSERPDFSLTAETLRDYSNYWSLIGSRLYAASADWLGVLTLRRQTSWETANDVWATHRVRIRRWLPVLERATSQLVTHASRHKVNSSQASTQESHTSRNFLSARRSGSNHKQC